MLLPVGRSRRLAIAACCGFGALVGIGRIAAGAHFLSDVAYAGLIVVTTSWLLYQAIVVRDLLASPTARRVWRAIGTGAGAAHRFLADLYVSPAGRVAVWAGAMTLIVEAAILWIDRPLALFLHRHAEWHPPAETIQRLGFGTPYLVAFSLGFVALRWGGLLPRLRPWAARMREAAIVPAFLFASVAVSGWRSICSRSFSAGPARSCSSPTARSISAGSASPPITGRFPSGHTAAVAALMTALWCLWPRHVLFYVALASVVAASRVVTGAHYLSDIVAGGFVAVLVTRAVAAGFVRFHLKLPFERGAAPQPVLPPP